MHTVPKVFPVFISLAWTSPRNYHQSCCLDCFYFFTSSSSQPPALLVSCLLCHLIRHRLTCLHVLFICLPALECAFLVSKPELPERSQVFFSYRLIFPKLLFFPAHICSTFHCWKMFFSIEKLKESRLVHLFRTSEPAPP